MASAVVSTAAAAEYEANSRPRLDPIIYQLLYNSTPPVCSTRQKNQNDYVFRFRLNRPPVQPSSCVLALTRRSLSHTLVAIGHARRGPGARYRPDFFVDFPFIFVVQAIKQYKLFRLASSPNTRRDASASSATSERRMDSA